MSANRPDVTQLLSEFASGDRAAGAELAEATYESLKRIAQRQLDNRKGTLQPTILVHEAYLSLFSGKPLATEDRAGFFRLAAKVMRDLLVDHARARSAAKRGGGRQRVTLANTAAAADAVGGREVDAIDLCDALDELAKLDERQHSVVDLRYFAGLPMQEIANTLDLSIATTEREWRAAKAWLSVRLRDSSAN